MAEKGENIQPNLIDIPKIPRDIDDFLTPEGKKKNSISTGMKRSEIEKLKKNKAKRGPVSTEAGNWPNEY